MNRLVSASMTVSLTRAKSSSQNSMRPRCGSTSLARDCFFLTTSSAVKSRVESAARGRGRSKHTHTHDRREEPR